MVFFHQRQRQIHSRCHSGGGVNIFVANKYWVRINLRTRSPLDENVTPVPMSCGPAAIEQSGSSEEHCAGANRTDSPDSWRDLSHPAHDVTAYLILLNGIATGDEQGVDLSAHLSKSFMRGDSQPTVRDKRSVGRGGNNFDGIDWRRSGILPTEHFRSASKDLKRPDQIEDLGPWRGYEHDPARSRWGWLLIIKVRAGPAVYPFHCLPRRLQVRLLTFILSSVEEER